MEKDESVCARQNEMQQTDFGSPQKLKAAQGIKIKHGSQHGASHRSLASVISHKRETKVGEGWD